MGLFGFGKKKKTTQSGQTASASVLTEIREEGKKDQLSDKINNMIKNFSALSKDERQYLEDNWMNMTTPQKFEYKEALGRYMEALSQNIRDPEAQEDLKFLAYRNQNYKENYDKTLKSLRGHLEKYNCNGLSKY